MEPISVPLPWLARENVYIGIDIGKRGHVAGLLSATLLRQHRRFEACPTFPFAESRAGFSALLAELLTYTTRARLCVLVEHTGHYHRPLVEFLQDEGIAVYLIHAQARHSQILKSDSRDALALANLLYNQVEKEVQVSDARATARLLAQPSAAAVFLRALMRHREDLSADLVRRKNQLRAITDELFPEFAECFKDPTGSSARIVRRRYPTGDALAAAAPAAVAEVASQLPASVRPKLSRLAAMAAASIGSRDPERRRALLLEERQLLDEFDLLGAHLSALDAEIATALDGSREGAILQSLPMIGPTAAATLLSAIGHVSAFKSAAQLKSYLGWAPRRTQTGTTTDRMALSRGGLRSSRRVLYLITINAVRMDTEWKALYERLVPKKCRYDERTKRYRGKMKVIGRVAGQIIELIYMLLMRDADTVAHTPEGQAPPPPLLYDRAIHRQHRAGGYVPARPATPSPPKASIRRIGPIP